MDQLHQLQQLQQRQQSQHTQQQTQPQTQQQTQPPQQSQFIPIQVSNGISKTKIATNVKTNPNPNAFVFSIPPAPKSGGTLEVTASGSTVSGSTASGSTASTAPLISMVQDVVLGMILHIPALRTKLQSILDNPSLMTAEISKVYGELQNKLTPQELEQLNAYVCQDGSRRTIGSVMRTAFSNIMADGKIDMNDAPHFMTLIHDCITLFATEATNSNAVALNSATVITFLHFVLKCILILTLDGSEEDAALLMLDCSFKLVKLTVLPLIAGKKWCCFS